MTNILHIVGHILVLDMGATREQDGSLVQTDTTEQIHVFGTAAPVCHWGVIMVLRGGLGAL